MTIENDFLPFAVGAGANVLTQAEYAALTALASGFQAGVAQSAALNKTWRQSSIMAAVLAQFIVAETGQPAIDDGTTATLLANFQTAVAAAARSQVVLTDTGTANTYAAANPAPLTALPTVSGLVQHISILNANTGASTYAPDGLAAKPVYGLNLSALQGGELIVKGIATLMYVVAASVNGGNGAWVLLRCAGGAMQIPAFSYGDTPPAGDSSNRLATTASIHVPLKSISASVAANALTLGFTPQGPMQFRNSSLTSGVPVALSAAAIGSPSLVVPSGATLGMTAGVSATLVLLLAYNAGSPVLCVANLSGGLVLDETNLISPTTISAGAVSQGTIYSASAVAANSPYRVVGMVQIAEAAAGTWATAPTLVQGAGGQAVTALGSFGFGQTVQTISRTLGTWYYNTEARPIFGNAYVSINGAANDVQVTVSNGTLTAPFYGSQSAISVQDSAVSYIVPPGWSYQIMSSNGATTGSINATELR